MIACEMFRCDGDLVSALLDPSMTNAYTSALEQEVHQLAEQSLRDHLRQMHRVLAALGAAGVDACRAQMPAELDALLTDIFAVASWHGWQLPVEHLGQHRKDLSQAQRGLLGYDASTGGAELYRCDETLVALVRDRSIDVDGGLVDPHAQH